MRLTISLVLLSLIAPAATAQQTARTLRGVVTTANDAPLARVRVAIDSTAVPEPVLTDERGQFTVRLPDTESIRLRFTKARYAVVTHDIRGSELKARERGQAQDVTLRLVRR